MNRRPNRSRRLSVESLERREMFASGIIERPGYPLYVDVSLQGKNLNILGTGLDNKVTWSYVRPEQVTYKKSDGSWLVPRDGKIYIEIGDSGPTVNGQAHPLRVTWVQANKVKNGWLYFEGRGGDDRFEHVKRNQKDYWDDFPVDIYALGGDGKDELHGYHGDDILIGEDQNDVLRGELGDDLLMGGPGNDTLIGDAPPPNASYAGTDSDYLIGGSQTDTMNGWQGHDILNGGNEWDVTDDAPDRLSGASGPDCFFFETAMDEEKRSDYNKLNPQDDEKHDFGEGSSPVRPPDIQEWLLERHGSIDPKGELAKIKASYPGVSQVVGPSSSAYNCIAAALGIYYTKVWPSPTPEFVTLAQLKSTFKNNGYGSAPPAKYVAANVTANSDTIERVILYGERDAKGNVKIFHAARQLADGRWLSKLGDQGLVIHYAPEDIAGVQYGQPLFVYERNRFIDPC